MGKRQEARLRERRLRQRQRQRAKTDRVAARNQGRADVAAATGTRAGDAWTGTVDNAINKAADFAGDLMNKDPGVDLAAAALADDTDDEAGEPNLFDKAKAWATENPGMAGLAGVAAAGAIGVATGVIKLK